MDENNNNEAPQQEQPEKKGFVDGVRDALGDYIGSVGMQVDAVWQRSGQLWDNGHKLMAVGNAVVCTPIVSHIAPITGLFGTDVFHELTESVKTINDERAKEKLEKHIGTSKLIGGIIVGAAVLGIGARLIHSGRQNGTY